MKLCIALIFFHFLNQTIFIICLVIAKFDTELYKDEPVKALYSKLLGPGVGGCHLH